MTRDGLHLITEALSCLDEYLSGLLEPAPDDASVPCVDPSLRGLVVTPAEVQALLRRPAGESATSEGGDRLGGRLWRRLEPQIAANRAAGVVLPLEIIRERFRLSVFETECLIVCLAAEVGAKYERLFAYLNDDITRKYPSVQLLLRMLTPPGEDPICYRRHLTVDAPLLSGGLLALTDEARTGAATSYLSQCLRVEPGVVRFLLEEDRLDPEFEELWHPHVFPAAAVRLWRDTEGMQTVAAAVDRYLQHPAETRERLVLVLQGQPGSGRRYAAQAVCEERGHGLLALDCERLVKHGDPGAALRRAFRDSVLYAAPLMLANADALFDGRERAPEVRAAVERGFSDRGWLLFIGLEQLGADVRRWLRRLPSLAIPFAESTIGQRAAQWERVLADEPLTDVETRTLAEALSAKFRLTPGQIAQAAQPLASELYRIDLSAVVSKYIGETEKNLSRVFREAERSDAILFFDEADALFGKRSEVRDAHDRYANIEINYLLQQMELYTGVAILATNQRHNLDEAFLRRIQIAVECPMPSADDRLRIWTKALPQSAPRSADVDLGFLARSFDFSGGNITNVGLSAAFLAAEAGDPITMEHLVHATQRELEKIGKRSIREEFGRYYAFVERPAPASA
jgi:AAA+ superfamily predicted ATPase